MPQCAYIIEKTHKRCKRQAEPGKKYCWQHEPKSANSGKVTKKVPIKSGTKKSYGPLYISVLPSDLSVELLQYLVPSAIDRLMLALNDYPELYTKLFPLDKLQRLYKTYIGTELPDYKVSPNEMIRLYLKDYIIYRQLKSPPASTTGFLSDAVDKTIIAFITKNWDIAIISYLNKLKTIVENHTFNYFLLNMYREAIYKNNLDIIERVFNNFDEYIINIITYSAIQKKYNITRAFLSRPEFRQLSDNEKQDVIQSIMTDIVNDKELLEYFHSLIPASLETIFNAELLNAFIRKNRDISEIRMVLDKLSPAIVNNPGLISASLANAFQDGNLKTIQLLLDYGADINADNESALLSAVFSGKPEDSQICIRSWNKSRSRRW